MKAPLRRPVAPLKVYRFARLLRIRGPVTLRWDISRGFGRARTRRVLAGVCALDMAPAVRISKTFEIDARVAPRGLVQLKVFRNTAQSQARATRNGDFRSPGDETFGRALNARLLLLLQRRRRRPIPLAPNESDERGAQRALLRANPCRIAAARATIRPIFGHFDTDWTTEV